MYLILFVTAFAANIALAIYLVANERTQAQPWRFLLAAFFTILLAYGFELGATAINNLVPSVEFPELSHLVKLTNLICGAFAGALASVAITNRAKFMHDKRTEELRLQFEKNENALTKVLGELKILIEAGNNPISDPGDASLLRDRTQKVSNLWLKLESQREKFAEEMRNLGIVLKD